jgi:hypothetical protein
MEKLELTRIESVKDWMPGGIGCVIRYSIDRISNPDFAKCLYLKAVKVAMTCDIISLAAAGQERGEFISSVLLRNDEDGEKPEMFAIGGTYSIEPDYRLLRRITRWASNFTSDEAITREEFRKAHGTEVGDKLYEKWIALDRRVEPMINYFRDDTENGQAFIGIVMTHVYKYEKRLVERYGYTDNK